MYGFVWGKTYCFCNLQKWKDFNKKQFTLHKMWVTSLLCGPWTDLWPFYGLYCNREKTVYNTTHKTAINRPTRERGNTQFLQCKLFFFLNWNPFVFVGYRNDRFFFPIQIPILRMLSNNADARPRSYVELGRPVISYISRAGDWYGYQFIIS